MPSLQDTYVDRTPNGTRLAVALALVLAGSVLAALGLVDAAASILVALGVPDATAGRLGVVAGGLVLPIAVATLHAVVPAAAHLRRVAAAGVAVAALGLALHYAFGGTAAATATYGVGVLATLWSLVAAATAATDRPTAADRPAAPVVDVDRQLYDGRARAGEHVTPADGGTEDDDITDLLGDRDE